MAENTTHSWSPWMVKGGTRVKTSGAYWRKPLVWDRKAYLSDVERATCEGGESPPEPYQRPRVILACDPFEDWQGPIVNAQGERLTVSNAIRTIDMRMSHVRSEMFHLIDQTPNLDYLLLTKRPENVFKNPDMWPLPTDQNKRSDFRKNVHLLYSASDQASLEAGIGHLLICRGLAPVLGLSLEPLVGPIDHGLAKALPIYREADTVTDRAMSFDKNARPCCCDEVQRQGAGWCRHDGNVRPWVDWIIVGGEAGPHAGASPGGGAAAGVGREDRSGTPRPCGRRSRRRRWWITSG